jgi:hypothetical protein
MAKSFAHEIITLTPQRYWGRDLDKSWWHPCDTGGCQEPALYWCSYRYVTGRAGNVSQQRRYACGHHAAKFAMRYRLPPPAPVACDGEKMRQTPVRWCAFEPAHGSFKSFTTLMQHYDQCPEAQRANGPEMPSDWPYDTPVAEFETWLDIAFSLTRGPNPKETSCAI